MDQARKGAAALASGDFKAAVSDYTEALAQNPQAVDYYIKRSTAYTRLSPPDHELAFKDAELAVVQATKRAKRELIGQAQLRRAIALFGLERWADSKQCLAWVKKFNEKENSLAIWEMKIAGKMKALAANDECAQVMVKEVPDVQVPEIKPANKVEKQEVSNAQAPEGTNDTAQTTSSTTAAPQPDVVQTPASKIRHEWYQQNDTVIVSLFAKGIPKDKSAVEIKGQSLEVSFPLPTGSDYNFSLDPLFANIDPAQSSYKIMSTKAEFTLKKAIQGQKWSSLEGTGPVSTSGAETEGNEEVKRAVLRGGENNGPAYPTSSRSGPKNWDKVANDLTKKKTKKDDDEDEEDEYDGEEGDPVNGFFKTLYKGADDDTKRAMMKSYQESNGTALSTNWGEVGKGKVETSPPDGMEAKSW